MPETNQGQETWIIIEGKILKSKNAGWGLLILWKQLLIKMNDICLLNENNQSSA